MAYDNAATLDMLGFPLLFIRPDDTKAPAQKGWPTIDVSDCLEEAFEVDPDQFIGVKLGGPTAFIDIEGDGPSAEVSWGILTHGIEIPETCSWTSTRGLHRLFEVPPELRGFTGEGIVHAGDLEIRLGCEEQYTHYSILPPMKGREWVGDLEVARLPYDLAVRIQALHKDQRPEYVGDYVNPQPDAPGSVFNERAEWCDLLLADGWSLLDSRSEGVSDWCRPGKSAGLSATTGFCGDRLYVFTTNAPHLESGASYSKFQYLTETRFKSDYKSSASWLASEGYARSATKAFDDIVESDPILSPKQMSIEAESELLNVSTDLLLFPGFVDNFAKFHAERSFRRDPRAGAVTGILFQSWLMGRRVMLADGTRPNIAAMLLGPSSCGKTAAVETLDYIIQQLGFHNSLHRKFKSWQALEDSLAVTPNMLFVQEEAQDLLSAITDTRGSAYMVGLSTVIKEVLTASKSSYRPRAGTKAEATPAPIDQPNLSILLTGLATEVWDTMTDKLLRDGFAGRLWPIELTKLSPRNEQPRTDQELLVNCMDHCKEWIARKTGEEAPMNDPNNVTVGRVIPDVVPETRGSLKMSKAFAFECDDILRDLTENDEAVASVWGRAHELLCTLQLLIAGSASMKNCKVTEETTERSLKIVRASIAQKIHRMNTRNSNHPDEYKRRSMLNFLRAQATDRQEYRVSWRKSYKSLHMDIHTFNTFICGMLLDGSIISDAVVSPDCSRVSIRGSFLSLPEFYKEKV